MNFCDNDVPCGEVERVRDVLSFLTYVTSIPMPDMQPGMEQKEWGGLCWILIACKETLELAEEAARK